MTYEFKTDAWSIDYVKSTIDHPVLWENHCHTQFEMIAVAEGDISVMLEGQKYRLTKNQVIIIPPLAYHSVTANEKGYYRRITTLFGLDAVPEPLHTEFTKRERAVFLASSLNVEKIKSLCHKEDRSFYAPLMQSLMTEIFYDVLQAPQAPFDTEADRFLQKALSYIDHHLHEKILLDDLAKATARSKSSFCHLFEEKMKISPKQYILQKKLAVAEKLIEEGTPRTLAATRVGYDNYSVFYRLYRKNAEKSTEKRP